MGTKISEATLREILKGSESLPIVDTDLPKGRTTIGILKEYVQPDLSGKQDKLVSGTNIKTVNGESILGSGDLVIENADNVYVISDEVYNTIYPSGTLGLDKVGEIKEAIRNNRGIVLEYNGKLNTLSNYQQNEESQYLGLSFISMDADNYAVILDVIMFDINTGTGETEVTKNFTPSLTTFGEQNHYLSGTGEYIQIPEVPTKTSELDNDSNFVTNEDLKEKVSGTGLTSIQVVTELPETQADGVLYIVQESEEETA